MGRKSVSGGVNPKGSDRIEFTLIYKGKRYRPTIERAPTEANLRRARLQLQAIKAKIKDGTFSFRDEFPNYRYQDELPDPKPEPPQPKPTCNEVFDAYLAHCEMRVEMNDLAFSTCQDYRRILKSVWRPKIGTELFENIVYSRLAGVLAKHTRNKKTYNNVAGSIRCAFAYGYKDHPEKHNPAMGITTFRVTKKDRLPIDPFSIQDAERVIAESHAEFGQAHGNFEEFRFFTGLRQSEQLTCCVWRRRMGTARRPCSRPTRPGSKEPRTPT